MDKHPAYILVVEDNRDMNELLRMMVQSLGYEAVKIVWEASRTGHLDPVIVMLLDQAVANSRVIVQVDQPAISMVKPLIGKERRRSDREGLQADRQTGASPVKSNAHQSTAIDKAPGAAL